MIKAINSVNFIKIQNNKKNNNTTSYQTQKSISNVSFQGTSKVINLFEKFFGKTIIEKLTDGVIKKTKFNPKGIKKSETLINTDKTRVKTKFEKDGKTPWHISKYGRFFSLKESHLLNEGKPFISRRYNEQSVKERFIFYLSSNSCKYEKTIGDDRVVDEIIKLKNPPEVGKIPEIKEKHLYFEE